MTLMQFKFCGNFLIWTVEVLLVDVELFCYNNYNLIYGKPYDEQPRFFTEGHEYLYDGRTNTQE